MTSGPPRPFRDRPGCSITATLVGVIIASVVVCGGCLGAIALLWVLR